MKRIKTLSDLLKEGFLGVGRDADTFSTLEIFEIAELIEREEGNFYKKAAALCTESELSELYIQLAAWREKQQKKIAHIRDMYSERTGEFIHIEDEKRPGIAEMMASLAMFASRPVTIKGDSAKEKKQKIIRDGIQRSKDAITYYSGLRDFAADEEGKNIIEKIVARERLYIDTLNKKLEAIKD